MTFKKTISLVALGSLAAMPASAADIQFNGFASVVGGMTLDDDETFIGYDDDISFDRDTLFALQASADLGEGLSATMQFLSRGIDDYDVELEWGYLSYEFNDEWRINAGKLRTPFFKYSDFLDVGFAYYWIRPPESVYNLPIQTFTGASVIYTTTLGDWDSVVQISGGREDDDSLAVGTEEALVDANNILGASWELTYDWFSTRIVYITAELDINSPGIDGAVSGFNAAGLTALASELAANEDDATFAGIGFSVDKDNLLVNAEYTYVEVEDSFVADQKAWYVSLGYRLGDWTPHITYENVDDEAQLDALALAPTAETQFVTNQVLNALVEEGSTVTVGARYDFHPAAAFKIEYTDFSDDLNPTADAQLVSFGIDLIF